MVLKLLKTAAAGAIVIAAGYYGLRLAAPEVADRMEALARDSVLGWSQQACSNSPVNCLQSADRQLAETERELSVAVRDLQIAAGDLARLIEEHRLLIQVNDRLVAEGEALLANPAAPISFAGAAYPDVPSLEAQLALLRQERAAMAADLATAEELQQSVGERLHEAMIRKAAISSQRGRIPARISLARTGQLLDGLDETVALMAEAESWTLVQSAESLLQTTRELAKRMDTKE